MEKKNYLKSNGIVMGIKDGTAIVQPNNSKLANRNYFVVGGPGSFKSQSFVMTNILHEKESSIVVTDPKGEVYECTAEIKRKQGYEVHVINFKDMMVSDGWNPFDYVRRDRDATTVANSIVASKNDPKHKDVWYNAQLGLLKALILYSIYEMPQEEQNITGILNFFQKNSCDIDEDTGTSSLDDRFLELDIMHPARRAYELGFMKSKAEARDSIVISLVTTIGDFVDKEVSNFMDKSSFNLKDIGVNKMIVYVIIPVMDPAWSGIINLLFSQIFQELYAEGDKHNARLLQDVIFLLDEFPSLGRFEDYEGFLATCRGYGIACCTILQNLSQLQDRYGKEKAESILGNCAVKICLGNVNEGTAKYFSDLAGKSTIKVETGSSSVNNGKNGSSSKSDSYSYVARNLINPDEILAMDEKESICIITGRHPTKVKKALQFELFPGITNKYRINQLDYERNDEFIPDNDRSKKIQEVKEGLKNADNKQELDMHKDNLEEEQEDKKVAMKSFFDQRKGE